jgi:hypothetical protein
MSDPSSEVYVNRREGVAVTQEWYQEYAAANEEYQQGVAEMSSSNMLHGFCVYDAFRRFKTTLHNEMGPRGPPTTVPVCVDYTPRVRQITNDFLFYLVIARFATYAPRGPYVRIWTPSE